MVTWLAGSNGTCLSGIVGCLQIPPSSREPRRGKRWRNNSARLLKLWGRVHWWDAEGKIQRRISFPQNSTWIIFVKSSFLLQEVSRLHLVTWCFRHCVLPVKTLTVCRSVPSSAAMLAVRSVATRNFSELSALFTTEYLQARQKTTHSKPHHAIHVTDIIIIVPGLDNVWFKTNKQTNTLYSYEMETHLLGLGNKVMMTSYKLKQIVCFFHDCHILQWDQAGRVSSVWCCSLLGIWHVADSLVSRNGPRLGGPHQHGDTFHPCTDTHSQEISYQVKND